MKQLLAIFIFITLTGCNSGTTTNPAVISASVTPLTPGQTVSITVTNSAKSGFISNPSVYLESWLSAVATNKNLNYNGSIDEFIVSIPGPIHPRRQVRNELIGQLEYRVQMDPPVSTKRSFAQVHQSPNEDANTLPPYAPVDQSPNEDANTLPPHAPVDQLPPAAKVARVELPNTTDNGAIGGRKNNHRKINKRKKCKSKRNRRNKNKNTRKKRKN